MSKQFQVVGGTLLVFRNLAESLYVLWALSLVECVAVWALKLPVPHTDVLKTHESQRVSSALRESKRLAAKYLTKFNCCTMNAGVVQ